MEGKWALGVVDVELIVLSHCENPVKEEAIDFVEKVFLDKVNARIPVSNFIGAYHILTRYLKVKRELAKKKLLKTLELRNLVNCRPPEPLFLFNLGKIFKITWTKENLKD